MRYADGDAALLAYYELRARLGSAKGAELMTRAISYAKECSGCRRRAWIHSRRRGPICARCGMAWQTKELEVARISSGRRGFARESELLELCTLGAMLRRLPVLHRRIFEASVAWGFPARLVLEDLERFPVPGAGSLTVRRIREILEDARGRFARKLKNAGRLRGET